MSVEEIATTVGTTGGIAEFQEWLGRTAKVVVRLGGSVRELGRVGASAVVLGRVGASAVVLGRVGASAVVLGRAMGGVRYPSAELRLPQESESKEVVSDHRSDCRGAMACWG